MEAPPQIKDPLAEILTEVHSSYVSVDNLDHWVEGIDHRIRAGESRSTKRDRRFEVFRQSTENSTGQGPPCLTAAYLSILRGVVLSLLRG